VLWLQDHRYRGISYLGHSRAPIYLCLQDHCLALASYSFEQSAATGLLKALGGAGDSRAGARPPDVLIFNVRIIIELRIPLLAAR
jgi:hypothetical protein